MYTAGTRIKKHCSVQSHIVITVVLYFGVFIIMAAPEPHVLNLNKEIWFIDSLIFSNQLYLVRVVVDPEPIPGA